MRDRLIQRFISHMNIPIHCGFNAGVSQQLLQHFRLHSAFNRTGCIGMAQRVYTKVIDPRFIAKLIEVGIIGTEFWEDRHAKLSVCDETLRSCLP